MGSVGRFVLINRVPQTAVTTGFAMKALASVSQHSQEHLARFRSAQEPTIAMVTGNVLTASASATLDSREQLVILSRVPTSALSMGSA